MILLHELRNRTYIFIIFLSNILLITYFYKNILLYIIVKPYLVTTNKYFYFIFTNITEVLYSYLTLTYYITFIFSLGFFFFTIVDFVWLGLYNYEKNQIKTIILYSFFLIFLNSFFLQTYILPFSCSFFLNYSHNLEDKLCFTFFFETKLKEYLCFYFNFFFINFITSQLLLLFILNWKFFFKTNNSIKKLKKTVYLLLIIFSTIMTPPDVLSQVLISVINIIIFECFTFFYLFFILVRQPIKANKYS